MTAAEIEALAREVEIALSPEYLMIPRDDPEGVVVRVLQAFDPVVVHFVSDPMRRVRCLGTSSCPHCYAGMRPLRRTQWAVEHNGERKIVDAGPRLTSLLVSHVGRGPTRIARRGHGSSTRYEVSRA